MSPEERAKRIATFLSKRQVKTPPWAIPSVVSNILCRQDIDPNSKDGKRVIELVQSAIGHETRGPTPNRKERLVKRKNGHGPRFRITQSCIFEAMRMAKARHDHMVRDLY